MADAETSTGDQAELLSKLGLLEGRMMAGRELIDAGQTELASPHFGHPIR